MTRGTILLILILLGLLGMAVWMAVGVWTMPEMGVPVSGHGFIALALGGLGTLLVGGGLMFLVFLSSRSGHDQAVHDEAQKRLPERDDGQG